MRTNLCAAVTFAATAVLAGDFKVDFSAASPACTVEHYQDNTAHKFGNFAGKPGLIIYKADKPGVTDTCWTFMSKPFPVTPGQEFVLGFRIGGDIPKRTFAPGTMLQWLDANDQPVKTVDQLGREVALYTNIPQPIPVPGQTWATVRVKDLVPSTAAKARVWMSEDHPNLKAGEQVVISGVAYVEHPLGKPWRYDDMEPPEIQLLTASPNDDFKASIRFRLTDKTGVDYSKLKIKFDGEDLGERLVRDGNEFTIPAPAAGWSPDSVHAIEVEAKDTLGNAGESADFVAFTASAVKHPKWTVRDDGMLLKDGEPWFPLGVCNVYGCEVNGRSLDRAVKDLMAAGMDFPHTYMVRNRGTDLDWGYDDFFDACAKYGAYVNAEPAKRKGEGRDQMMFENLILGRTQKATCVWTLGDDTTATQLPRDLKRSQAICRAIDPDALTMSIDGIRHAAYQVPYIPYADILAIEDYPIREMEIRDDTMAVFARALDWAWDSVNIAKVPNRSVMSLPQSFKGWNCWPRYPKYEEIRVFAYISIVCRARGIFYYTYHKPVKSGNQGVMSTPERRDEFFGLMKEIAALRPSLVKRDAVRQPKVKALSGPQQNVLGMESIRVLLKEDGLLIAANTAHLPVKAEIQLPDGRRIVHEFPRYGVWTERIRGL